MAEAKKDDERNRKVGWAEPHASPEYTRQQ